MTCDRDASSASGCIGRGADAEDADRRIAAQGDIAERLRPAATRVIDTSGRSRRRGRVAAVGRRAGTRLERTR